MSKDIEGLNISLKTLLSVGAIIFLLIGEYILLHKEIEEAKRLPTTEVTKVEFEYIKRDVQTLHKEVNDIKKTLNEAL
ncbi:MAG: hypothetical protein Unbinned6486contig1001_22 [Prokaryotic dsDNA virus sp.]|nr:MAG: hypothetical protein Unbinned6486contig1001_22 [Prokaryotic dsDNA virus sp.]|tara:strand:+ start:4574 stop:4807 length:234 start_codon:yes stop_codon:yes gene_type:complete